MRHCQAMVLVVLAGSLVGCVTGKPEQTTALFNPRQAFQGPTGDDVVQLLVALVERPAGDRALNQELWTLADEQSITLENKPETGQLLEKNGLRMGQFGSAPPGSLQELIRSKRSCSNPECIVMHAGKPTTIVLSPAWTRCLFDLHEDNADRPVDLDQAECQLQVVPTLAADNRTRLDFTPCIKHGKPTLTPQPVHAPSGTLDWDLQLKQPIEAYSALSWQQTIGESEYLVLGTWLDRPETLGQRCFIWTEGSQPVQRLLVLRARRGAAVPASIEQMFRRSPSLALQANYGAVRGSQP
jgi:hypothetical protein